MRYLRFIDIFLGCLFGMSCGSAYTEENLALNKPTRSSSRTSTAYYAVDGNASPYFMQHPCSHTDFEVNPWWIVDLGDIYPVNRVDLTNRGDCCSNRLRNFTITISRRVKMDGSTLVEASQCRHYQTAAVGAAATVSYPCATQVFARYIKVQLHLAKEVLTLCEVKVWGNIQPLGACPAYWGIEGKKVSSMVLGLIQVASRLHCFLGCSKTPNCASVNIEEQAGSSVLCELLEDIRETDYSEITAITGWKFYRSTEN